MEKKYQVIYADPPVSYTDKCHSGKRGAGYKYSLMSDSEILGLPVREIAARDSVLFLWATFPRLPLALEIVKAWGFEYRTLAYSWLKTNPKSGTPFWGMGNWTRSNQEVCLLGVRGKPKRVSASVHSVIQSPIRKHSQKPDEVRDRIVELLGDIPRVELFARTQTQGWDAWGDQAGPNGITLFQENRTEEGNE